MLSYDDSLKREYSEKLVKLIEPFPDEQKIHIKEIIRELFPQTADTLKESNRATSFYQKWNDNKRISSELYFDKYFSLGVSKDDISDEKLKNFLDALNTKDDNENKTNIEKLISNKREYVFLQKISIVVNNLDENQSIKLAKAISLLGNSLSKGNRNDLLVPPFSYAARLLRNLLENVSEANRKEVAIEIASIASPLDFASEFFRFAKYIGMERGEEYLKHTDLGKAIISQIVDRTKIEANKAILEEIYPQHSADLYLQWLREDPKSIKEYLKNRIQENPKYAEDFILSFRKQAWEAGSVARLWGFDFIVEEITKLYPEIEILHMENYSENNSYVSETVQQFFQYFVSISKKISILNSTQY